jgi:molybdopterin synthase sulfur carrier subunit
VKLLYFAWIRTRIGRAEENVDPPSTVQTVGDLLDWLEQRDDTYRTALANRKAVRVAVNHDYVAYDRLISADDEIALFPPVTGG